MLDETAQRIYNIAKYGYYSPEPKTYWQNQILEPDKKYTITLKPENIMKTLVKKSFVLGDYNYQIAEDKSVTVSIVLPGVEAKSIKVSKLSDDLVVEADALDLVLGKTTEKVKFRYTLPKYTYSGTSATYKNGILTVKLEAVQFAGDEIPVTIGE